MGALPPNPHKLFEKKLDQKLNGGRMRGCSSNIIACIHQIKPPLKGVWG